MPRFGGSASRGFGASGGFPGGRGSAVAILDYAAQERIVAQYLYDHAGVPTDGTNGTYAQVALPGALLIDIDAKTLYQNTGTQASPVWTERSAASGGGSAEAPLALETSVGEDSIPLTLTGQPDQEAPLFRVVDSTSDDDKLFEVFGYKSGSFLVARDFYRHEFLEVLATADGHVGEITINSGTSDTVLRSRAADTQLSLSHDRIVLGNGGATDRLWLAAGKVIFTQATAAPDDAALSAGHMALWLDQTNGAAKLMVKAKQADGTVVTGSVNLSA
jgi:hypothetical protein